MTELSEVGIFDKNLKSLSTEELIIILKNMYESASYGYKVTMIHLFGIEYANKLKNKSLKNISYAATGRFSFATEISKGIKLSEFVKKND